MHSLVPDFKKITCTYSCFMMLCQLLNNGLPVLPFPWLLQDFKSSSLAFFKWLNVLVLSQGKENNWWIIALKHNYDHYYQSHSMTNYSLVSFLKASSTNVILISLSCFSPLFVCHPFLLWNSLFLFYNTDYLSEDSRWCAGMSGMSPSVCSTRTCLYLLCWPWTHLLLYTIYCLSYCI